MNLINSIPKADYEILELNRGKTNPPVIVIVVILPASAEISIPVVLDNVGIPVSVVTVVTILSTYNVLIVYYPY